MTERILVGNFVGFPVFFKQFLKKFAYEMTYNSEKELLTFDAIHPQMQSSPLTIFQLRNTPHESAVKFAELLGLEVVYTKEYPVKWKTRIPTVLVWHTGDADADKVIIELVRLDLPYFIFPDCKVLGISFGEVHEYWKEGEAQVAEIIDAIRTFAAKHGKLKAEPVA